MAYTPIQVTLGELPECPGQNVTYPLSGIPDSATEVLVYAFVTTHNDGPFQRGFYVLSTSGQGDTKYSQYLNVASGSPAVTVASATCGSLWAGRPKNWTSSWCIQAIRRRALRTKWAASTPKIWRPVNGATSSFLDTGEKRARLRLCAFSTRSIWRRNSALLWNRYSW